MASKGKPSLFQTLPLVVWRRVVRLIHSDAGADGADIDMLDRIVRQQRGLVEHAGVCVLLREVLVERIYAECAFILGSDGQPLNGLARNKGLVARYAKTLYIKVSATVPIDTNTITTRLARLLPETLPLLHSIVVEAADRIACNANHDIGHNTSVVRMPRLADIHVVGRLGNRRSAGIHDAAALAIARSLATMSGMPMTGQTLSDGWPNLAAHTVVAPLWVSSSAFLGPHSLGSSAAVLRFSDVSVIEGGAELIRATRATLSHLTFMRCRFNQLEALLYLADGAPVQYPNLLTIHGALSIDEESRGFRVPEGAFPKLEYLYEAVCYEWQYRLGVVSHLLFDKLSEIWLPALRAIRLRTSRQMSLTYENLPALEHVSYYTRSETPERLDGTQVCGQLCKLLRLPNLLFLRYYDQVPAVCLVSSVDVQCRYLRHLDVGLITVSYDNVERILAALPILHSFWLAVNDRWSPVSEGLVPLSVSLRVLGIYVVDTDPVFQGDCGAVTPSKMIVSRLPALRWLYLQDNGDGLRGFLDLMGREQRFEWSRDVADKVQIGVVDLFGRGS